MVWLKGARWILRMCLPGNRYESVLGDIEEEFRTDVAPWRGRWSARLWYWRQCVSFASVYLRGDWPKDRAPAPVRKSRDGMSVSIRHLLVPKPREKAMNHLRADIKYATRSLWNARGFSLVAVLTLAIGIGANAGMFSLVNAVILRPLPYEDPERLVAVRTANPVRGVDSMDSSPPDYFDWRDQSDSFEELAAYWSPELNLTGNGEPERLLGAVVTWTLFDVFAVRSQLGRLFTEDEDSPGGEPVALISDGLWRRRFGADRSVIGRSITLNEVPRTIVGVLVPGFEFPLEGTEVWIPGRYSPTDPSNPTFEAADYRSFRILGVVGRLGSGVSIDEVRADLGTVAARLEGEYPESNDGYTVRVLGLHEHTVGSLRPGLLLLLGAVSCLLLIASVNVAGMILARGADRRREIAIRVAMGANARRVVGQLLVESSILALVGGILGCVGAYLVIPIMTVLAPASLPMSEAVRVDATVVFYAFGVTALTGVLFGLFPALYAATPDLAGALRQTANRLTTSASGKLRKGLVVAQMALAMVLLVSSALLIETFRQLRSVDPGFEAASVPVARIELPRGYWEPTISGDFFEDFRKRVAALPGVDGAALSMGVPLEARAEFFVDESTFQIDGRPLPLSERPVARMHIVSPDFFETMRVPVRDGRAFDARDTIDSLPVVVINQTMADRYWPGENPIGQRLTHDLVFVSGEKNDREVVGVVGDVRHFDLDRPADAQMYLPHSQRAWPTQALLIRSSVDPLSLAGPVRDVLWGMDDAIPVASMATLENVIATELSSPRFRATLTGVFAATALLLAAIGLYGLMAYSVSCRTHEIGLRMALGASSGEILRLVVGQALRLTAVGVALGSVAALVAAGLLMDLLFGVGTTDVPTFVVVASVVLGVAVLASFVPARRATRVAPLVAMRGE